MTFPAFLRAPWVRWSGLLLLCSAYLQGGINKLTDFGGAVAEMQHLGLTGAFVLVAWYDIQKGKDGTR